MLCHLALVVKNVPAVAFDEPFVPRTYHRIDSFKIICQESFRLLSKGGHLHRHLQKVEEDERPHQDKPGDGKHARTEYDHPGAESWLSAEYCLVDR
ncbi:MAG: hypothetical protein M4579_002657 [Chaenotheca gracillima]|nr:MAG: hypothetical protein M4579_002657 [Chaenotheca gracillima]